MMNLLAEISPTTLALITVGLACLTVLSLTLVGLTYFHFRRLYNLQDNQLNMARDDLGALCNGAVGLGDRLSRLDTRVGQLLKRQEHLEMQEAPERSFKQAIKLVRQGADIDQLMSDCGLARGEAELVVLSKQLDHAV